MEETLRWKNQVLYTGEIETGSAAAIIAAEARYVYEGATDQPALPENAMIGAVTAAYSPGSAS